MREQSEIGGKANRVRVLLAATVGLGLILLAIGVLLSGSPPLIAGTNSIRGGEELATFKGPAAFCQSKEELPPDTSAIRLSVFAIYGPRVNVRAYLGNQTITEGTRGSGWIGERVTVPVHHVSDKVSGVKICAKFGKTQENMILAGDSTTAGVAATGGAGQVLPGRLRIEYIKSGHMSWLSLAHKVTTRIGIGRAPGGTWPVLLLLIAMGSVVAITLLWTVRDLQ